VTTTTTTTISGVSLITGPAGRAPEQFEIILSSGGIDFRRPKRPGARLTWDKVSGWEIEERANDIVLTLQGAGAATPLLIPGWSASDLGALLRRLSEQPAATAAPDQAGETDEPKQATNAKGAAKTDDAGTKSAGAGRPGVVELLGTAAAGAENADPVQAPLQRARPLPQWKAVVTIALLGVLVAAVTIVLLQSAGIISWSILGPTS